MVYEGILTRFTTRTSGGSNVQSVRDGSLPQKPWPVICALTQGRNRTSKLNQHVQLYELWPKLFHILGAIFVMKCLCQPPGWESTGAKCIRNNGMKSWRGGRGRRKLLRDDESQYSSVMHYSTNEWILKDRVESISFGVLRVSSSAIAERHKLTPRSLDTKATRFKRRILDSWNEWEVGPWIGGSR